MTVTLTLLAVSAGAPVLFISWRTLWLLNARARYEKAEAALEAWMIEHIGKYPFDPDCQKAIRRKCDALKAYRQAQSKAPAIIRHVLTDDPERLSRQSEHLESMLL